LQVFPFTYSLQSKNESTLLLYAIKSGNLDQVKLLISPLNVNALIEPENCTPLIVALKSNQPKIVDFLLENGADPNFRCNGRTPLMYACKVISKTQIKLLLDHQVNINDTDSTGTTSLMIAAAIQPVSVAKLLIRHGASLNVRNKIGLTARDYSIHSNNKSMTSYLRSVFERRLPNYSDGPYASFISHKKLEISYIKHDSLHQRTIKYATVYDWKKYDHYIMRINGDESTYEIPQTFDPEKTT
jgi:ankyrin repeat protein